MDGTLIGQQNMNKWEFKQKNMRGSIIIRMKVDGQGNTRSLIDFMEILQVQFIVGKF